LVSEPKARKRARTRCARLWGRTWVFTEGEKV
jgi:hypothetical protein